ncbi:uncharacterized protein LOC113417692 [Notechis scutatus]|uniref:Uncharacterized protein LOC113417692 n=1 Tax=Notechis scutatus TaxID=8663 RepID=A0A6J1UNL7_9SAUR|nr:uncharacterized protein LOC113417692 [Notechis scutatus]
MVSCISIVPWACLHTRTLQWFLLLYQRSGMQIWSACQYPGPGGSLRKESPSVGGLGSSRTTVAPIDHLAFEQRVLGQLNFSNKVIQTIQVSRRPSTNRIYDSTWRAFCGWCSKGHIDPTSVSVAQFLEFLQEGLDKSLFPNTIHRQVATLASVLSCGDLESLALHPTLRRFIRGATNLKPPVVHRNPTWDLPKVLQALISAPFDLLQEACSFSLSRWPSLWPSLRPDKYLNWWPSP